MTPYQRAKKLLSGLFRLIYRLEIKGKENIPEESGYMVCCNHIALFDPVMLAIAFPHQLHFMVKRESMESPFGGFLKKLGCFGINRGTADTVSLKTAMNYLKNGECLGLFPQGTRRAGVDPRTTEVKTGAAMIARRTGCDVIPVFLKTKNRKLRPFSKTCVIIGKPIKNEDLGISNGTAAEYRAAVDLIFDRICSLGEEDR